MLPRMPFGSVYTRHADIVITPDLQTFCKGPTARFVKILHSSEQDIADLPSCAYEDVGSCLREPCFDKCQKFNNDLFLNIVRQRSKHCERNLTAFERNPALVRPKLV